MPQLLDNNEEAVVPDYEDNLSGKKVPTTTEALATNNINNDNSPVNRHPLWPNASLIYKIC